MIAQYFRQKDEYPWILRLDIAGMAVGWLDWRAAACLYAREQVIWTLGDVVHIVRGGYSRRRARRTELPIHSIVACRGKSRHRYRDKPRLCNRTLFMRDDYSCLYCGERFPRSELTRDHVVPKSRGGEDTWLNCVTACRRCNHNKDDRTLEESGVELLALPYRPNFAEYLALCNTGRILGDQMNLLHAQFPAARNAGQ